MGSVVLGLHGFSGLGHDAAAALVVGDEVLAAVEEERLIRKKRAIRRPPVAAIKEVLSVAGIRPQEIDRIAYPWDPVAVGIDASRVEDAIASWFTAAGFPRPKDLRVEFIKHHEAHAWSGIAFVPDDVRPLRLAALVVDGSGESTAGGLFTVSDGDLEQRWLLGQQGSLGVYYEAASEYVGFPLGNEGKTMGLASYGRLNGRAVPELPDARFDGDLPRAPVEGPAAEEHYGRLRRRLIDQLRALHGDSLSFNERADVALAAQEAVSERMLLYVHEILDEIDVLVVAGGVALNCFINSAIATACAHAGVRLVIPPPASDTGIALGAAIAASDVPLSVRCADPYLGRDLAPGAIVDELGRAGAAAWEVSLDEIADELVERSAVCGWLTGRAEIGPRALGRRSLIACPGSTRIRDRINFQKGRESWRPLAPSVTAEEFERSFDGHPSRHMLITATVRPAARDALAAVVHVDATSRPQVVDDASAFDRLLRAVGARTSCEALVCTSFNRAGEPMVYTPTYALRSARAMDLDLLAGDGWCARLGNRFRG